MKRICALLLATTALAAEDPCPPCGFLASARPCVQNPCVLEQSDVYLQFSFLYWLAQERGLDYAMKNTASQYDASLKLYQPDFDWQPAFRIVVGSHLPQDQWSLDFSWSFYLNTINSAAKHNFTGNFGDGLLAVWTAPGAFTSTNLYARWRRATSEWKLHANFFDLVLRHNLCNGKALSFQPSFGLKMALLQQRYEVQYTFGNSYSTGGAPESFISSTIAMKNRSFNLGPSAGVSTHWSLNRHWSFNSALSGAVVASQFDVGRNELDVSAIAATQLGSYRFNQDFWTLRPQASLSFGLEWSDCVCQPRKVVQYGFKGSYEMQYWWKQNMMLRHIDAPIVQSHTVAPAQGDLVFQGLTVDLFFDF